MLRDTASVGEFKPLIVFLFELMGIIWSYLRMSFMPPRIGEGSLTLELSNAVAPFVVARTLG